MIVESLTHDWQPLQNAVSGLTSPERGSASIIALLSSSFLTRLIPILADSTTDWSATDVLSSSGSVDAFSFVGLGLSHNNPRSIPPPRVAERVSTHLGSVSSMPWQRLRCSIQSFMMNLSFGLRSTHSLHALQYMR